MAERNRNILMILQADYPPDIRLTKEIADSKGCGQFYLTQFGDGKKCGSFHLNSSDTLGPVFSRL